MEMQCRGRVAGAMWLGLVLLACATQSEGMAVPASMDVVDANNGTTPSPNATSSSTTVMNSTAMSTTATNTTAAPPTTTAAPGNTTATTTPVVTTSTTAGNTNVTTTTPAATTTSTNQPSNTTTAASTSTTYIVSSHANSHGSNANKRNEGAIIGGVFGGIALLGLVAVVFFKMRSNPSSYSQL
ncbi:uncharacterized protein MONBRDRAFT_10228 [Monosiga brevicollis MX1]|uniref:Uncharacterized protein n=1 Tax=Monosiga brevicollis TaxID=81824 RepID=A9V5L1_MONBE|nr:uncharacterized protein MONBRDRAFT_10228 [Monosiga brevicollis MX1]EDQ87059.1 predicted protein [Monosiga brevicollis MX1]|eukprot:XP_001748002.1 hypothetical protein [Monosiga brevicollis MX1]